NLFCTFCQNWDIARAKPEDIPARYVSPEEIESTVQQSDVIGVAFTYNEPTIFGEYVVDISRLVKSRGYKTVMVSNGFITPEAVKDIYPLIDAANIDLKAFSNDFYRKECKGQLTPVLDALVEIKKQGTFLEITTLVIPGLNNMEHDIDRMTRWIVENLGKETPYHISAFYPSYQMKHIHRTTKSELDFVKNIADSNGLQYVYEGNIMTTTESNTYCPSCGKLLIERRGYRTVNNLDKNQCSCGREIPVEL
ncbi:MAG: AmmeMemoRadiSam system radical SAM enzyme, partial [Candidatus Neomarinimicrobiota bacterium]